MLLRAAARWGASTSAGATGRGRQGTTPEGREGAPEMTAGAGRQPPSLQGPSGQAHTRTRMASSCGSSSPVNRQTPGSVKQEQMRKKAQQGRAQSHPPHCGGPGCPSGGVAPSGPEAGGVALPAPRPLRAYTSTPALGRDLASPRPPRQPGLLPQVRRASTASPGPAWGAGPSITSRGAQEGHSPLPVIVFGQINNNP